MSYTRAKKNAVIVSFAHIGHGRSIDEEADFIFYDVIIPTSGNVNGSRELLCALVYAPNYDEAIIEPGIYRIHAEVSCYVFGDVNWLIVIGARPLSGC